MDGKLLIQLVVFLGVAALAAPLARMLKLGSILGYLLAGAFIGPYGIGYMLGYSTNDAEMLRHIAELGVAMFLFLIGLELRLKRLWKMREGVFGAGSAQFVVTGVLLVVLIWGINPSTDLSFSEAMLVGLTLALSSTVLALQTLEEKGELTTRHGRLAFSVLLFQDIAAIPLLVAVPLLAVKASSPELLTVAGVVKIFAAIALIIVAGRYVLDRLYHLLALTQVREAMIAASLLTVAAVSLLMTSIGLSASLGAFLAGVLLADSHFRHQLEADIKPFEMLLLALFFTSIGMALDYHALLRQPFLIAAAVITLVAVKFAVLYAVGRWQRLNKPSARRFAIVASQGGEFAFVVFASAEQGGVLTSALASSLGIIVTLSMMTTPLLLALDDFLRKRTVKAEPLYDDLPATAGHVVIAGFGRVGQVVARVLTAKGIPFTALDADPDQVQLVGQFGNKSYFGDASRLAILEAAEVGKARAFVLAIDDVESSLKAAQLVKAYFPHVPIYARARNRRHVHQLMDLGVENIEREAFYSTLEITRDLLRGLGLSEGEIRFTIETFREHDEARLYEDYAHYTDVERMAALAMQRSEELAQLLAQDWEKAAERTKRAEEKKRADEKKRQDDKKAEEKKKAEAKAKASTLAEGKPVTSPPA
ncbi:cation:proton antiporter [Rhodomicrobium lacus]|uniref:cation:proton antiporter domain-containing protein n=1 Tax=Rhodomicrobium TaxID=1068 RepID=UPI0026E36902|nr:cation:proton antiporter [Rhodomicrobium lacus]WKW52435.1 cation:proton antiporter [Rhodomicrobium lacus]